MENNDTIVLISDDRDVTPSNVIILDIGFFAISLPLMAMALGPVGIPFTAFSYAGWKFYHKMR